MRLSATATVLLGACILAVPVLGAAPVVRDIEIRNLGSGSVDSGYVLAHTRTRAGDELDRRRVAGDVKKLLSSGRFSHVDAEIAEIEDGVRLVYAIRNKHRLAEPVVIHGIGWYRARRLRDLIELQPGDLVDDQVMAARSIRIEESYRERSFNDVSVSWEIEEAGLEAGLAKVTLTVNEGERSRVRDVRFSGNELVTGKALWKAVEPRPWWNLARWFKRMQYGPDELEAARLRVLDLYLNKGFLDVKVRQPRLARDDEGCLVLTVAVEEGVSYRFGKIVIEGVSIFPEAEIERLVAAKEGETASAGSLRRTVGAVEDYYGSRGYVNAVANPMLDADEKSGVVSVRLGIVEGELVKIRNVRVEGNTRTRDKVIRRELLVYPGDVFDEVKVRRSERIVSNLGYFSAVRSYPVRTAAADEQDLIFEVEEKRTGQFMVGMGYSSVDRVIGFAELSQGNFDIRGWPYFTGGGQKLKLRGQFGDTRKSYDLSFVEPWFLDRKLSLGVDLYRSEVSYTDYDIQRTGAAASLGRALPWANRLDLRYRLERVVLSDVADTNRYFYVDAADEEYFFEREEDRTESSLRLTLTHDTRNNPFIPTRGTRVTLFGSVSGGYLGFDTDVYGLGARVVQYVPLWFGHVLSARARYEIVEAYGDAETVPIGNRLFAGGGRTIRGFDYRDVGPKVIPVGSSTVRYRPVGGQSLAIATAEYTVPLVEGLRLAAFYDIGNVWREPYEFDPDRLASSAGIGARIDLPGFPVRIDYAWVIDKDHPITDEDPWVIWIGYDY